MTKKTRKAIHKAIAAEILFSSDRTCCICNNRSKRAQIHHIDDNPSNNILENLAVLCFDCHDKTMIKGGIGRGLDAVQVKMYRDDWIERVQKRRDKADELASIEMVTGIELESEKIQKPIEDFLHYKTINNPNLLESYLKKLLSVHKVQLAIAQSKIDECVTVFMLEGSNDMIDFYHKALIELATFFPKYHFNDLHPKTFFNQMTSDRFNWHGLMINPTGEELIGTTALVSINLGVMLDLKNMIVEVVSALLYPNHDDNYINNWKEEWLRED